MSQDPTGAAYDMDLSHYLLVPDQIHYQGWYQSTVDGSWYKPDTNEFYSAGSSPVATYDPYADPAWLAAQVNVGAASTQASTGYDSYLTPDAQNDNSTSADNPNNGYIIF
jgi:hypothetical protein